jgi:dinuclear metal center YbgI/SA1388 family protein
MNSVQDILNILNEIAPFSFQESWDNSGVQVGSLKEEFSKMYIGLEIDDTVLENSEENSLILTHHPLIFGGLKKLNWETYPSNLIQKAIQKNLKIISLHTNYDKFVLNRFVLKEILGFEESGKIGDFVLVSEIDMELEEFLKVVKEKFKLEILTASKHLPKRVSKIALTTGSGGSLLSEIGNSVDIFLTGDLKYHTFMEEKSIGLGVLDIGHYNSEIFFGESLQKELEKFGIETEILNSENPISII